MTKKVVTIVQGALYGSEAKGAATLAIIERLKRNNPEKIAWAIRTGSINAGHSVVVVSPGQ